MGENRKRRKNTINTILKMSKVITFSRKFTSYHPKAGDPTYFVESFYNSIFSRNNLMDYPNGIEINDCILSIKNHTIRKGNRFKKGDFFSPRVWGTDVNPKSGKSGPYHSKQIILCNDVEIANVWDIRILVQDFGKSGLQSVITINGQDFQNIELLAKNDGLSLQDFLQWFKTEKGETFVGQIICWNENVKY